MVRISKQQERRHVSKRRPRPPMEKTGARRENLSLGYKPHVNAVEGDLSQKMFIPKMKIARAK